ncbi:phosphatidylinositol N-acetylglucosaminyltransferase subunit P [Ceratobasidium sp. AG-Ba]|nr:phosphatidylinositol N-acetylglucosaminyltransferase subunit P [Ceratobasidium sp. AG-Ba]
MSANDAHNNEHKANLLKRRSRRSASINDLQEPTSPSSPVAAYPPLLIPEDELPAGSAPEFYGFVAWLATAIFGDYVVPKPRMGTSYTIAESSKTPHFVEEPVPQAYDLPIGFVNQVLYGKRSRGHG